MKRFNVFTSPTAKSGILSSVLIGEAVENRDGTISVVMGSVPLGFTGQLTLIERVAQNVPVPKREGSR